MLKAFLVAISMSFFLSLSGGAKAQETAVMVTIAGKISMTNRGPRDDFHDAFHVYHGKTFDRAFSLNHELLGFLPQKAVRVDSVNWPGPVMVEGPLLSDVLKSAGASGKAISVTALDGYEVEFSAEELAARDWILAIRADEKPLAIGGRGPAWVVYETGDRKASEEEEAKWVWSVFYIDVK